MAAGTKPDFDELVKYLEPDFLSSQSLHRELESLGNEFLVLLLISPENFSKINEELLRILLVERKLSGIYISGNKPFEKLAKNLSGKGINSSKMIVVDCSPRSEKERGSLKAPSNIVLVGSPDDLSSLSIGFRKAVTSLKEKDFFVILDSISTLSIYNEPMLVEKFVHSLSTQLRAIPKVKGILVAIDSIESDASLRKLSQFCDRIISIK
ncbi:MAG: hypothetical protein J4224_00475 [Candidatus Diapherotrites archaeon]|uniref:KaiC-like domain-containing protein n=1 Tax=Candidatus Iainarchaeum sp. TaxID=3101447 RepID=A0A7J4IWR0_9ARCH|nr:MAG: hypothetical protein QT03_C0001G0461 [archaeon GW2011_AR10]MBS3058883.1 hypothetical protein [Candidatus Diapherotrites archaeon]HIH08719.1 hypothetical protein [Candidatus Diapherotrites archaeon]